MKFDIIYEEAMNASETIKKVEDRETFCQEVEKKYEAMKGHPDENINIKNTDNLTKYKTENYVDYYEMKGPDGDIVAGAAIEENPKLIWVSELMALVSHHGYGSRLLKYIFNKFSGKLVMLTQDWKADEKLGEIYRKCGMTPINTKMKEDGQKVIYWYFLNGTNLKDVKNTIIDKIHEMAELDQDF